VEASVKAEVEKPVPSEKSMKVKEPSVKLSEKPVPSEKSVKIEVNDVNEIKSVKVASVSLNPDEIVNNSPAKSQKSNQINQFLNVDYE
jgi:hypothetical protein